jgi:hypothetical protein
MDAISKQAVKDVAQRTGLKEGTVLDLLRSGWMYTVDLHFGPRWVQPQKDQRNAWA